MEQKQLTFEEIERDLKSEVERAVDFVSKNISPDRMARWDRYYGRELGNEQVGRSKYISRDVMDTIEWMLPHFIRTFASGDPKISIKVKGQSPKIGQALMKKIQEDLSESEPNMFMLFYQWFKDALVSNTSIIKSSWNLDQEKIKHDFGTINAENMQQLSMDPDVELESAEQDWTPFGIVFHNVRAKIIKTTENQIYAENMPHWEFICSPDSRGINDEFGKGQQTEVTLDYLKRINRAYSTEEEPYFQFLDQFEDGAPQSDTAQDETTSSVEAEKDNYEDVATDDINRGPDGPGALLKFVEWYDRIDVDGDGFLEHCTAWFANGKMIRYEINEEGFIPLSAISPIIDCHKMFGISWADLLVDLQNLKTMLTRRILDNFDFAVNGRWRVDPAGEVDTRALLNNVSGEIIHGKEGAIEDISPKTMDFRSIGLLQYVDLLKEDRGGVPKLSKGMGDDSKTDTAGGINKLMGAASQRLDMVSRVFAETGIKDFYKKTAWLYQRHQQTPFTVTLRGEEVEITPEMLQGKVTCTVNLGIETAVGQQEAQKIERITAYLSKLAERWPGIITEEDIHSIATKYVASMGFPETKDFVADFEKFMQENQKAKQNAMKMKQMELQAEQGIKVGEQKLKALDIQGGQKIETAKMKQDMVKHQESTAQKDKDSRRDYEVDLIKTAIEIMMPNIEQRIKMAMAESRQVVQ